MFWNLLWFLASLTLSWDPPPEEDPRRVTLLGKGATQDHLVLTCTYSAFHFERLWEWLQSVCASNTEARVVPTTWGWDVLVGTSGGRSWLGRFLVAGRPRWTMQDLFQSEFSDSAVEGA